MNAVSHRLFVLTAALAVCLGSAFAAEQESDKLSPGVLYLRDGSFLTGEFQTALEPQVVSWQGLEFTQPFEFLASDISSINFPLDETLKNMTGHFAVELTSGDQLSGNLRAWNNDRIQLETPQLGILNIEQSVIRRIDRIDGNPTVVFSGLSGLRDWNVTEGDWNFSGAEIWTEDPDSYLSGNFQLPEQVMVEFEIAWETTPNFSLAIGVEPLDPSKKPEGWSFDTWNSQITLVRERENIAAIEPVYKLSKSDKKFRCYAFLDRVQEKIQVYGSDGTLLAKASLPPLEDKEQWKKTTGILFASHFGKTRLSQLRVMRWDGRLPLTEDAEASRFRMKDGSTLLGDLTKFDATTDELTIVSPTSEQQVPLEQIVAAEFPKSQNQSLAPLLVVLHDRSRLSGELESVDSRQLVLKSPACLEPVKIPRHWIRSIIVQKPSSTVTPDTNEARNGRLEMANHKIEGHLVAGAKGEEKSCLVWKPQFSRTSSPLQRAASGRIIYVERKPPEPENKQSQPQARPVRQQNNVFGNFAKLFLKNAENVRPVNPPQTNQMHSLHLMSGDMLPCRVVSIDERGVHISSDTVEANLIPHDKIKALVLQNQSAKLNLDEEKKARLLTLPRNQKSSPPTHLLYSPEGDFLRCRLMNYFPEQMTVEVHLTEMTMPSTRVSHIIWLHPEILLKSLKENSAEADAPLVAEKPTTQSPNRMHDLQVIFADGNRSTFSPGEVTSTRIVGQSDVIGRCSYLISSAAELAFGEGIREASRELPFHQWVLTPAPEPLYMTATDGGTADDGLASAFVGKPAPDFQLDLLRGERFVLSEQKGKIIALDFWATWCGPCILTMPLMEEAMKQFDPDKVELISVNLEERPEQVREVLERHQFSAKVAMDIDGAIARRYQVDSIPQLVLVDQNGNVARLYIGGGQGVVDQFAASVKELLENPPASGGP